MSQHPTLEYLSRFVLETLPWALSGLIGLYLLWGFYAAPPPAHTHFKPGAEPSIPLMASGDASQSARTQHAGFEASHNAAPVWASPRAHEAM
jgi:hypothetical protein